MTRSIPYAALSLMLLVCARFGVAGAAVDAGVEEAVLAVHREMDAAASALDAERFFSFILDSATVPVIQDGRLFATRAGALQAVKKGFEGVARIERSYEATRVSPISERAALLTGSGTSTVTLLDGRTFTRPFAVSVVFTLRDGEWKVLHGHYSVPARQ